MRRGKQRTSLWQRILELRESQIAWAAAIVFGLVFYILSAPIIDGIIMATPGGPHPIFVDLHQVAFYPVLYWKYSSPSYHKIYMREFLFAMRMCGYKPPHTPYPDGGGLVPYTPAKSRRTNK